VNATRPPARRASATARGPVRRQLPTSEVAGVLSVCEDTVRELISTGQLPARNIATKPGDVRWRVDEGALAAYLESRTYQPPSSRRVGVA
jgi:excisionase family DNA binding protein